MPGYESNTPQGVTLVVPDRQIRWLAMTLAISADAVVGFAALVVIPYGRLGAWLPSTGRAVYLLHAVLGLVVGVGSIAVGVGAAHDTRIRRGASIAGVAGVGLAGAGGVLASFHGLRLAGIALMFVGSGFAVLAYLAPLLASRTNPASGADDDAAAQSVE